MVLSQEHQAVSKSRALIMHAVDPHTYMVNRLKRLAVQIKELYSYETLTGDFFILSGSNSEEKPSTAYVVMSPQRDQDFWPQAVWLSCLDTLAAIPRKKSTLFVLIPPDTDISTIISEISQFDALSAIVVFENSNSGSTIQLKSASKNGQSPRSVLMQLYSIFKSEGLQWTESPASSFFHRFRYYPETGLLSGFHEQNLPAFSLLVNLSASEKPGNEALLLTALSKLESNETMPASFEYNYLNLSSRIYHGAISEKSLLIILLGCFSMILALRFFSEKNAIGLGEISGLLLHGIALLIVLSIITVIFILVSSMSVVESIRNDYPLMGFIGSAIIFLLLNIASFLIYFPLLKYAKLAYESGYLVYFLLLIDTVFFAIVYLPVSTYFCLCALIFLVSRRKLWLSFLCCVSLSAPLVVIAFLNARVPAAARLIGLDPVIIQQALISTLVLCPFFLWIGIIIDQWFSLPVKKWLAICTALSLAVLLVVMLIKASGNLL